MTKGDHPKVLIGRCEDLTQALKTACTIIAANNLHKDNEYIQAVLEGADESISTFHRRHEINWVLEGEDD